jgi:uncharacterized protein (TIGR03083 family)
MRLSPRYDGPSILAFDGPADDEFEPVSRQRRRMEALLADLDDDEWASPTRCDEWTIQDVIAHLVTVNAFWEASVRAGLDGAPTRLLARFDPAAHPAQMVDGMRALSPHEVFDQFVASNDGFIGALVKLDEQGWSALAESPPGHVPIRALAHHALWDAWIHERDIALPMGRTPVEEPDEVRSCLRYAAALSPALAIDDDAPVSEVQELGVVARRPDVHFTVEIGESVAVRDGAPREGVPILAGDSVQLVEALSVRGALPAGTPVEWHRVLEGLETVFNAGSHTI